MSNYQHILVAIDLSEESQEVIDRAKALAQSCNAKLTLAHVVEPITFAYGGDIPVDLTEIQTQLEKQATEKLAACAQSIGLPNIDHHVIIGQPKSEIHELADNLSIDLIVVGSHGRKGLALLLGSTANGILHGAKCDVLAVRVNT